MNTALTIQTYRLGRRTFAFDLSLAFILLLSMLWSVSLLLEKIELTIVLALAILVMIVARHMSTRFLAISLFAFLSLTCASSLTGFPFGRLSWLANINLVAYLASVLLVVSVDVLTSRPVSTPVGCALCATSCLAGGILLIVQSSGALIAAALACAYLFWHRGHRWIAILWLLNIPLCLVLNEGWSYLQRLTIWRSVLIAPGAALPYGAIHAHNLPLEIVHQIGLLPGIAIIACLAALAHFLWRSGTSSAAAVLCIGVGALVDYIYWYPFMLAITGVWLVWSLRPDRV